MNKDYERAISGHPFRNVKEKPVKGYVCANCHEPGFLLRAMKDKHWYHEKCEKVMIPFEETS